MSKEKGGTSEEEAQRQELLNKIRKFGHFATTKIAPKELDLESKSDDAKLVEKSETKEPDTKKVGTYLVFWTVCQWLKMSPNKNKMYITDKKKL